MARRNILLDGDSGLLKKSRVVKDFNFRLHMLLDDMRETLISANGLGIAAPQVGVLRRAALIVDLPDKTEKEADADSAKTQMADIDKDYEHSMSDDETVNIEEHIVELVNPEILSEEGEQCGNEGCLSLPGRYGIVKRPQTVRIRAQDRYGRTFEMEASAMTARAICHEVNHLDGIIFTSIAERMLSDDEVEEMRKER